MNRTEVQELLTFAASFDRRQVTEGDVLAWYELLSDVEYRDAYEAVARHYARSETRLYPATVRAGVTSLRERRISQVVDEAPPEVDPDDVAGYLEAVAHRRAELADGRAVPLPQLPSVPAPEEFVHRDGREQAITGVLAVGCPWCKAAPGERCSSRGRPLRQSPHHPSRADAARSAEQEAS